jgi:hypothetical protein
MSKTKAQLLEEIEFLKSHIAELEAQLAEEVACNKRQNSWNIHKNDLTSRGPKSRKSTAQEITAYLQEQYRVCVDAGMDKTDAKAEANRLTGKKFTVKYPETGGYYGPEALRKKL